MQLFVLDIMYYLNDNPRAPIVFQTTMSENEAFAYYFTNDDNEEEFKLITAKISNQEMLNWIKQLLSSDDNDDNNNNNNNVSISWPSPFSVFRYWALKAGIFNMCT